MTAGDLEPDDVASARIELAAPAPALADRLARAELKARLFGAPAESTRIGRYAVLRRIGAGGMGVVYAAYDEQLDRKVAIKLVQPGLHDPDASARSRREAQALARLSHPNVVQIHEVGEYAGQVYLAMEFIQGHTLRAWQRLAARRWQDTLAMYVQAGRGLAAAHARGLVHRDFKPDNVLVGDEDQRPRVLDFGLARVPGAGGELSPGTDGPDAPGRDLSPGTDSAYPHDMSPGTGNAHIEAARLTTPGAVLGTPAYMAPEQLAGGEADARSDVFSFCAALFEALHGARPFAGDDRETLLREIRRGTLARPTDPADLPAWLQRAIVRGLAADPAARWPGMDPLLAALTRDPTRWRRRAAVVVVGLLVVGGGVLGLLEFRERRQAEALAAEQARAAEVTAALQRTEAARAAEQRRSEARRLATLAGRVAEVDPVARLLLAVEAVAQHTRVGAEPVVEAEQALLDALDSVRSTPFLRPGAAVVDAVAESPDGRWLATGERGGAVTLWRTDAPGTPLPLLPADGHAVHTLAFSPDGAHLAASRVDTGGPLVWKLPAVPEDRRSGTPAPKDRPSDTAASPPVPKDSPDSATASLTPPVPEDSPLSAPVRWHSPVSGLRDLEWSPRGDLLLARAGLVVLILRADGEARALSGHTAPVRRAAWSRDGAQVVTASADGTARVWAVRGGPPRIVKLQGTPRRGLWSAEFSPDGRELALASADHTAAIVPLHGGPVVRLRGHGDAVYAAAFSPDGERVITVAMDDSARVWERDGSSARIDLPGHAEALGGARLGPERDLLLGTPPGGAAWLWQIDRPGPPLALHGHAGSVVAARFSADSRRVLTASTDGSARVWRFADDPDILRGHDAGIEHASFAPDGHSIVTASMDGTTRVWPRDGGRPLLLRGHREGSSVTAAFSPDSLLLASAGSDGLARLWSLTTRPPTLLATLPAEAERGPALLDVQWSPDATRLALAADDGRIFLIKKSADDPHPKTAEILRAHTGPVRVVAFSPDSRRMISAGDDGRIVAWDLQKSPVPSDILGEHDKPVRSLAFAPGERLLSAGDDATVRIWSLREKTPPQVLQGHAGAIWQVRPLADDIVSASADGVALVWPADGGAPTVLGGHGDAVWIAAPNPAGDAILTTASGGAARLWRRRSDEWSALLLPQAGTASAGEPDHTLWTGSFSPDGRHVLTAGADGLARVFPAHLADQVAEACARAGRNLDRATWTRLVGEQSYQRSCPTFE